MQSVNTSHDDGGYGRSVYLHGDSIFDANHLYQAMQDSRKNSDWKGSVQKFCMDWLINLGKIQEDGYRYDFGETYKFTLSERGKTRVIDGERFDDRVVTHSICDNVLNPKVRPKMIYDNGASLPGKGIDFTRRRLVTHLSRFYRRTGSNQGWILLLDYEKYYDNIVHDTLLESFGECVQNPGAIKLIDKAVRRGEIDVSYMSDWEYQNSMDTVFDSVKYEQIPKELKTGKRFMQKHLNVGNQISQSAGTFYSNPIDTYIKTVRGVKEYGRYMDDSYIIHEDKSFLEDLLRGIKIEAAPLGIIISDRKTRICKLDSNWRFLQIQYSLTDTGRIVRKINPKRLTKMRRKMKKLAGQLTKKEFHDLFYGWFMAHKKYMSHLQKENLQALYTEMMEEHYD